MPYEHKMMIQSSNNATSKEFFHAKDTKINRGSIICVSYHLYMEVNSVLFQCTI